jgi:excisionase family DNA binding protein
MPEPPPPPAAPLLLTVPETARALAICTKSLWQLTRDGRLPAVRIGRAVRYSREDIVRFIERAKSGAPLGAAP